MERDKVYVIMTEVNGYKNIYGHVLYWDVKEAEGMAQRVAEEGKYEEVYVTTWKVI